MEFYNMNVETLEEGNVYKNYKELCDSLNIKPKTGNSKISQMKEIQRYCIIKREGNKLKVGEVFDDPLPELSKGGKSIYGDMLLLLLSDFLIDRWKQTGENTIFISRNKMLEEVRMINSNYSIGSANINIISEITNINTNVIFDFFNTSSGLFRYSIESSLKKLRDMALAMYSKSTMIHRRDKTSSVATPEEKDFILECEREALDFYDFMDIIQARSSKDWINFKNRVKINLHLSKEFQIKYYYTVFEITINSKYIEDTHNKNLLNVMNEAERDNNRSDLNTLICSRLLDNAINRNSKTTEQSSLYKSRKSLSYIKDSEKLIDVFINETTRELTSEINYRKTMND